MIQQAIKKLVEGIDLTAQEMTEAFSDIMSGNAGPEQISAFITALRMKGETVKEITAAARVMRKFASRIDVRRGKDDVILDTCGTGGSGKDRFNISTTVAFVVAGCSVKVAKHGNRSASGRCGSADLLEALGVNINLSPQEVAECIRNKGIGFLFAPVFHSAMKYAGPVRKAIGIRTIFNILGPLSNPADATCQILGVYDKALTPVMAKVLGNLGLKRAFVVHGLDGIDEISITGPTQISELRNNKVKTYKITPQNHGFKRAALKAIKGGSAQVNAGILLDILGGKKGARRDVVLLNSAYALVCAGKARDVSSGIRMAEVSIDSGAAMRRLEGLRDR